MLLEYGVWTVRLIVAAVFAVAAIGKFADRSATEHALRDFAIPERHVRRAARWLPAVEAVVAGAILLPYVGVAAAVAASVLLVVFTAAVVRTMNSGRRPRCACFGTASTAPIGRHTVIRNAVLTVVIAAALAGAIAYPRQPLTLHPGFAFGLATVVAFAAALVWQQLELRRLQQRILRLTPRRPSVAPDGLPIGATAPEFALPATDGTERTLADLLRPGLPVVLVFLHPDCGPCRALSGELPRWRERRQGQLEIVAIGSGSPDENRTWADDGIPWVLLQDQHEIARRYHVRTTPSAVAVDEDGRISVPVAGGVGAIRELVATAPVLM